MVNLTDFDKLIDRVASRLNEGTEMTVRLEDELTRTKKLLEEKELEKIRALKEKDRRIDELEREKTALLKEKELVENKLEDVYKRIRALFPDADHYERRA